MRTALKLALFCCLLTVATHATTFQCGYTVIGGASPGGNGLEATLTPCVPLYSGTVSDVQIYIGTAGSGDIGVAIIDSNAGAHGGTAGAPYSLLCQAALGGTPTGSSWNVLTGTCAGLSVTAGHLYWLARNTTGSSTALGVDAVGTTHGYYFAQACCTFVTFSTSPTTTGNARDSIFADISYTDTSSHCGADTVLSLNTSVSADTEYAFTKCAPSAPGTVGFIHIWAALDSPWIRNAVVGIADSDGSGGKPGTLLCQSSAFDFMPGFWSGGAVSGCGTLTAFHNYWVLVDGGSTYKIHYDTSGSDLQYWFSQANPMTNFPGSPSQSGGPAIASLYFDLIPTGVVHKRGFVIASMKQKNLQPSVLPLPVMGELTCCNPFGSNETGVRGNADAVVSTGMLAAWTAFGSPLYQDPDIGEWLTRDGTTHLLQENATAYPSGLASTTAYVHSKGQKVVAYLSTGPGPTDGCNNSVGSTSWESYDVPTALAAGFDWLRYDDCYYGSSIGVKPAFAAMRSALNANGTRIPYTVSLSIGPVGSTVTTWAPPAPVEGNEIFTYYQYSDHGDWGTNGWTNLQNVVDWQFGLESSVGPNHYHTPDFLRWCTICSNLTTAEKRSQFSLWAIFAANMWLGDDITVAGWNVSADGVIALNSDVLAIDQDPLGISGKRVSQTACGSANCECYAKQLSSSKWAIVGWNRASTTQTVTCTFVDFGGASSYTGYDDIAHSTLGTLTTNYAASVPSHDSYTVTLTP